MRVLFKSSYKSIAEANLRRFRHNAKTLSVCKGMTYELRTETEENSLGFDVTTYKIIQTN